jgi:N-acylneuraminate cytidylyltransferase
MDLTNNNSTISTKQPDRVVTLIPARGGSKGIVDKNIRFVAGLPLLAHSILHAKQTPSMSRIIVSTDHQAIASIAAQFGAEVIWRPAEISGDTASSESALLHALDYLRDEEGYEPSLVVFLQATSPLRHPNDIQNSIDTLTREGADSLFSACPAHGFVWRNEGERLSSVTYDYRNRPRRQDTFEHLIENGSIYVFKPWVLRDLNNRLGGNIATYRMDPLDSFQIDEPQDLAIAEALFNLRQNKTIDRDLSAIKLLALDFDGVMTDNRVLVDQDGKEAVWCNRSDGWGIARLKETGVEVVVISTEANPVVRARCEKLNIACVNACDDKLGALKKIADERSFSPEEIAFVGNDVNDLDCLRWAGVPIAVADATPEAKAASSLVTQQPGGYGAVREVTEWLMSARISRGESGREEKISNATVHSAK